MLQSPSSNMSMNLLFNSQLSSPSTSSTIPTPDQLPQFYSSPSSSQFSSDNIFTKSPFEISLPSTSSTTSLPPSSSIINPSSASTLLVAAAAKAAATTATLLNQQQQQQQMQRSQNHSSSITRTDDEQKIDDLLLPALIGHEISNLLSHQNTSPQATHHPQQLQQPSSSTSSIWRCANLPTTLQILNTARENYPNYISTIDTLRQSLTQTIFVSLINASTTSGLSSSVNGIEMPTIASLAPNNTSLHLNTQQFQQVHPVSSVEISSTESVNDKMMPNGSIYQAVIPQISPSLNNFSPVPSLESRRDSLPFNISSPAKSEFSVITDTSSVDIKQDMGALSIKAEKPEKSSLRHVKKRVMCEKCQKSFCDKGALKIHTSSVHLREMHICTIPGCAKQFPSKRSRNRHSNNPNMHTDAGRRRNCRSAVSTVKSEPSSESPQPQQLQPSQNHDTSAHSILSLLQKLIPTGIQHASPTQPLAPTLPSPVSHHSDSSGSLPLPSLPLPTSNPELSGLLRFMIAQRSSKPTLC